MKSHRGFTILEVLISISLSILIMGFFFPSWLNSLIILSQEIQQIHRLEAALLTTLRLSQEKLPENHWHVLSPQELWLIQSDPREPRKRIKFEQQILRIYEERSVYPITAKGDVQRVEFLQEPGSGVTMQWDRWRIPLR